MILIVLSWDGMKTSPRNVLIEVVLVYVGLDIQKRFCDATVLDPGGPTIAQDQRNVSKIRAVS